MNRESWHAVIHGVAKSQTQLSDWTELQNLTGFCHKSIEVTMEPHSRAPLLLHSGCVIHSHKHTRVSKVQQKPCFLAEQRTRASSILTLPWSIPDELPRWKVVAERHKDARILGLQRRRIQSRASDKLLCNNVLLKYKRDRESFWHGHQKAAERVPTC